MWMNSPTSSHLHSTLWDNVPLLNHVSTTATGSQKTTESGTITPGWTFGQFLEFTWHKHSRPVNGAQYLCRQDVTVVL